MIINMTKRNRSVKGVSPQDLQKINSFILGQVKLWCKNNKNAWFSMRSFMGGSNRNWNNTPLQALYDKNVKAGVKKPYNATAVDAGYLLQEVLLNMPDLFETKLNRIREYNKI